MAGSRRLAAATYVQNEHGEVVWFQPGDDVPSWAAKLIDNPDAWVDGAPAADDGDADEDSASYSEWLKADLEAEIDRRNEDRDEAGLIVVAEPGNKPQLIEALEADDQQS